MAARSFLGAGDIYINRLVGGVAQGMKGPYKANKLEIKPNVETKESTSKGRDDYGQVLETVQLNQPADFTMELKEIVGDVLLMAFLGTSVAFNQTAGTLVDQAVTIKKGSWVDIGKKNLDGVIVVENADNSVTYVEGTDYKLNKPLGLIMVLPSSAIVDAVVLEVSGAYKAATGQLVSGATKVDVRAHVLFDGINLADGQQVTVNIWEAVVAADSAFDFLADDFNNVSLVGKLKTPADKTEPFTVLMQDPVV